MVKRVMIIAVVTAIIDGRMNALVQCGGCVELKTRWGRTVLWNTKIVTFKLSHSLLLRPKPHKFYPLPSTDKNYLLDLSFLNFSDTILNNVIYPFGTSAFTSG